MKMGQPRPNIGRLLRCAKTGRYYKSNGWTHHAAEATRFPDQLGAVRACFDLGLENIELVLLDPDANEIFSTRIR